MARLASGGFGALAFLAGLTPASRPARHGVERLRDVAYGPHPRQHLDVFRPIGRTSGLPVVFYIHGGGFRAMSKDSHWLMGLAFARRGHLVFNVDYRLAPQHPFPTPAQDVFAAWAWVLDHLEEYGGDPERVVVAGESAGANLCCALTIAACYPRPEPWARAVFDRGRVPDAALPACGILQVSAPERFLQRRALPWYVRDMLFDPMACYLGEQAPEAHPLADPLLLLEAGQPPARPLPRVFAAVGTRDPILDDTRRLGAALARLGVEHTVRVYPGEIHAFHALVWRPAARACWREMLAFIE